MQTRESEDLLPHVAFAESRVILMAAPNGARRMPADHPAIPLTPAELAACAVSLCKQQVAVFHLHVRDGEGRHSLDAGTYRHAIAAIRKAVGDDMIVQVTTEAASRYRPDEQMQLVRDLQPEAVSLALREICADDAAVDEAAGFFDGMRNAGTWPQIILYDANDVARFDGLRRDGVFADAHPHVLFVLGRYSANLAGEPEELQAFLDAADCTQFPWGVCCFGSREHDAALLAMKHGGHVRLGFENNLQLPDGQVADSNAALFEQLHASISGHVRRPASAAEVRRLLARSL